MTKKWENSTSILQYIKPHIEKYNRCRIYEVKLNRLHIGHTRLTHGHLILRNDQQSECKKPEIDNKTLLLAKTLIEGQ